MTEYVFLIGPMDEMMARPNSGQPFLVEDENDNRMVAANKAIDLYYQKIGSRLGEEKATLGYVEVSTTLKPGMIASCKNELESNGFVMSDDYVLGLIKSHTVLRARLLGWYQESAGDGLDTADRDELHDAFAQDIGAMRWPMYRDSGTNYEKDFIAKVKAAVAEGKFAFADNSGWVKVA